MASMINGMRHRFHRMSARYKKNCLKKNFRPVSAIITLEKTGRHRRLRSAFLTTALKARF